nr:hypothetical protein [Frankia sp. Cppng1_Ct_nod]
MAGGRLARCQTVAVGIWSISCRNSRTWGTVCHPATASFSVYKLFMIRLEWVWRPIGSARRPSVADGGLSAAGQFEQTGVEAGNAVNFLHGASVGTFIFLVQAEIFAGIRMLTRGDLAPGMHEVPAADRAAIAAIWLSYFNR